MSIDRELLRTLRDEMNTALQAVAKRHNLLIAVGNASFTETTANFKLAIATNTGDAETPAQQKAAEDWQRYAARFGLDPAWLNKTYTYGGDEYEILGLMPKRSKYPVYVRKNGDKCVLVVADHCKLGMSAKPAKRRARA